MVNNNMTVIYRTAFLSAIVMTALIPVQIMIFAVAPPPGTVAEYLDLFRRSPLLGLLSLDLLYVVNSILIIPMYLALFFSLKDVSRSAMILAMTFGFIGLAAYFPSNICFEMLSLSTRYAESAAPIQQQALLAAGEALLATYVGTSFNVYYVLNAITLLLSSLVMFKSCAYTRSTAWIGLISGILMIIPSTAGLIGMIFSILSLIPWIIFTVLVALRFRLFASYVLVPGTKT